MHFKVHFSRYLSWLVESHVTRPGIQSFMATTHSIFKLLFSRREETILNKPQGVHIIKMNTEMHAMKEYNERCTQKLNLVGYHFSKHIVNPEYHFNIHEWFLLPTTQDCIKQALASQQNQIGVL